MLNLQRAITGLAAAFILAAATPAICADASPPPSPHSLELARKLFNEMQMDQMMSSAMRQMGPAMIAQSRKANPNLTDEQAKAISEAVTESGEDLMHKMVERVVPMYAETFTERELQDLVNFYDTPSGRAMLAKMPTMMSKMTPIITELMPEMTADVSRRLCAKTDCSKISAPGKPSA